MKIIQIKNHNLLFDDEDYDYFKDISIYLNNSRGRIFAIAHIDGVNHYVQRYIMNYPKQNIRFKDGNRLNLQKSNMELCITDKYEYRKKYYQENKESLIKKTEEWIENNREKHNKYTRITAKRYPEKIKKMRTEYLKRPEVKEHISEYYKSKNRTDNYRYRYSKGKCKSRGKEFLLTKEEYIDIINRPCYYSGEDLSKEMGIGLDRIDNAKGYTLDNVLPCIGWVNKIRNNLLTVAETVHIIKSLLEFRKNNTEAGLITLEAKNEKKPNA